MSDLKDGMYGDGFGQSRKTRGPPENQNRNHNIFDNVDDKDEERHNVERGE